MLVLFDLDDTLVFSFMRHAQRSADAFDKVQVLPGRVARLASLIADGHEIAIATNQAGVSHGYQTERQVLAKLADVRVALGLVPSTACYVCFAHASKPLLGDGPQWDLAWRKPAPGMLLSAMDDHGYAPEDALFVGDMDSDRQAARAAGVRYAHADDFFDVH